MPVALCVLYDDVHQIAYRNGVVAEVVRGLTARHPSEFVTVVTCGPDGSLPKLSWERGVDKLLAQLESNTPSDGEALETVQRPLKLVTKAAVGLFSLYMDNLDAFDELETLPQMVVFGPRSVEELPSSLEIPDDVVVHTVEFGPQQNILQTTKSLYSQIMEGGGITSVNGEASAETGTGQSEGQEETSVLAQLAQQWAGTHVYIEEEQREVEEAAEEVLTISSLKRFAADVTFGHLSFPCTLHPDPFLSTLHTEHPSVFGAQMSLMGFLPASQVTYAPVLSEHWVVPQLRVTERDMEHYTAMIEQGGGNQGGNGEEDGAWKESEATLFTELLSNSLQRCDPPHVALLELSLGHFALLDVAATGETDSRGHSVMAMVLTVLQPGKHQIPWLPELHTLVLSAYKTLDERTRREMYVGGNSDTKNDDGDDDEGSSRRKRGSGSRGSDAMETEAATNSSSSSSSSSSSVVAGQSLLGIAGGDVAGEDGLQVPPEPEWLPLEAVQGRLDAWLDTLSGDEKMFRRVLDRVQALADSLPRSESQLRYVCGVVVDITRVFQVAGLIEATQGILLSTWTTLTSSSEGAAILQSLLSSLRQQQQILTGSEH